MDAKFLCLVLCLSFWYGSIYGLTEAQIEMIGKSEDWPQFLNERASHLKKSTKGSGYKNFNCSTSQQIDPPKDIHSLAPKYVSVVAAMGDSLTAANGADADRLTGVALQYRGLSFSIGGDGDLENTLTLPNVIKKFNSKVYGASKRISTVKNELWSVLNVGVPGARAKDLVSQAKMLTERLGKHTQYKDSWKVVTIFIGANDICNCNNQTDPDTLVSGWISEISSAIDILAGDLSNTFINLVNVIMVGELRAYEDYYTSCAVTHEVYCSCVTTAYKNHDQTDAVIRKYQQAMYAVPERYQDRSDFTVVLQPFSENIIIPTVPTHDNGTKPDLAFLAPDCFHFSKIGHTSAAATLWNGMLTPIQKKQNIMDPNVVELQCPDPDCPYLRTAVNSVSCSKQSSTK